MSAADYKPTPTPVYFVDPADYSGIPIYIDGLTPEQAAALTAGTSPSNQLFNVVLAGDSITAQNNMTLTPTSVTSFGTTATVTQTNHSLAVGQQATIQGCTQAGYNGCWRVASVVDANSYTVTLDTTPSATPATGSPQVVVGNSYANHGFLAYCQQLNLALANNAGLGGDTTSGLYARLARDVFAYTRDVTIVLIGINNLRSGGATAEATWTGVAGSEGIKEIVDAELAKGKRVVLCTLMPLGNGDAYFSSAVGGKTCQQRIMAVNRSIRSYCLTTPNLYLADIYKTVVDPTQTDGRALASALHDNLHLSPYGAQLVEPVISAALVLAGAKPAILVSSAFDSYQRDTDSKNAAYNPTMQGTGGSKSAGVTGSIADSFRGEAGGTASAVGSLVARTVANDGDTYGNNQVVVVTSAANNDSFTLRTFITYTAEAVAGDMLSMTCDLGVSSISALKYVYGYVQVTIDGVSWFGYWSATGVGTAPQAIRKAIKTATVEVPAGTITAIHAGVVVTFSGAGGATLSVGRFSNNKA
jgi:lysophospholipase L1-like esterase